MRSKGEDEAEQGGQAVEENRISRLRVAARATTALHFAELGHNSRNLELSVNAIFRIQSPLKIMILILAEYSKIWQKKALMSDLYSAKLVSSCSTIMDSSHLAN